MLFSSLVVRFQIGSTIRALDLQYPFMYDVPSLSEGEIRGLLVCIVYAAKKNPTRLVQRDYSMKINIYIIKLEAYGTCTNWKTFTVLPITCEDHFFVYHTPLIKK
jgi:hypothetical protein